MGSSTDSTCRHGAMSGPRAKALREVFAQFDLNDNGYIETWELYLLGRTRRRLGQKQAEWTEEMNRDCIDRMDENKDGLVEESEFIKYFSESLTKDPDAFMEIIGDFLKVANQSRGERDEQKAQNKKSGRKPGAGRAAEPEAALSPMSKDVERVKAEQKAAKASKDQDVPLSPRAAKDRAQKEKNDRRASALRGVYREFDLDGGGDVGGEEMLALGKARRKLGQKKGEWTEEMNRNLLSNMGADKKGNVSEGNFVSYFNASLSIEDSEFDTTVRQFLD